MRRAQFDCLSQPVRNLFTNPSCETTSGLVVNRTNLATNPSMETTSGTINVRTNLATNPSFETASGTINVRTNLFNWSTLLLGAGASQTAGVVFSGSTWTRLSTTTAGHGIRAFTNLADLVNGEIYEPEWELANDGTTAVSVGMDWCDSSYTTFTLAAGERRRCKVTGVSGITYSDVYRFSDIQLEGANTSILFREILIEKIKILGPYFDGATAAAGDFTYAWSGTANASTSYQQAPGVDDVSMVTSLAMAYQSKEGFSSGTKALRITPTTASTDTFAGLWASAANTVAWKANTTYTIAGDRTITAAQAGASGVAFRVNIGTELNVTLKAPITNVAGTQRVVGTFTTGASTALNFLRVYNGASAGNGDVWWDKVIVEEGDTGGAYFDGATPAAGDFTYVWSGAANASTSYQRGVPVTGFSSSNLYAISSTQWKLSGAKGLRTIPNAATQDSFSHVEGDTGAMRLGMQAGKTYTVSATCYLAAPQTGTLANAARTIRLFYRIGTGAYASADSANAPNAAGSTRLSVTFTLPTGTTEAFVRLQNGASAGGGDVWWDDILVEETSTLQPYFDGATAAADDFTHAWSGVANASTSQKKANAVKGFLVNSCTLVQSSEWSASGTKSLRIVPTGTLSFAYVTIAGSDNVLTVGGLVPGRKYTVSAKLRLSQLLPDPVSGSALAIYYRAITGGSDITIAKGTNTIGVQTVRGVFTVPSTGTYGQLRLYNTAPVGTADTWWDEIMIVEGDYPGPYIDGTKPFSRWDGVVNDSTSVGYGK